MRVKETVTTAATGGAERSPDLAGVHLGTIVALLPDGTPHIEIAPGRQRTIARLAVRTSRERIETAIALQQQVVVQFENGDRARPIIMGFIERLDEAPLPKTECQPVVEADVDGSRVRVTAQDEIVLECGSASITLRRNGRVIVRGTYIETHSDGTNRIKGGQVQIN
jgi:hypothetical protein